MKNLYEIEGRRWLRIVRAAELIGTNAQGVRKLMGDGSLEWRQSRVNSRTFVVCEVAVMAMRKERPTAKLLRSPDPPTTTRMNANSRRERGSAWTAHHLRLTLPVSDESQPKPKEEPE